MINTKTCDILGQLYVFLIISCKKIHSKIPSYEKVKKDKERTNNPSIN